MYDAILPHEKTITHVNDGWGRQENGRWKTSMNLSQELQYGNS